jgi:uncharacterized Zn finger protein (UPF0148 family)
MSQRGTCALCGAAWRTGAVACDICQTNQINEIDITRRREALALLANDTTAIRDWMDREREQAHEDGARAGRIKVYDELIREVQERLAAVDRYMDTRPYTELLVLLADKRRAETP